MISIRSLILPLLILVFAACNASSQSAPNNQLKPYSVPYSESPADTDKSLVTITSQYTDIYNQARKSVIQGSGFLVSHNNRVFVITASHVSQGEDLKITQGAQSLTSIGRLYDGAGDLEIIEVQNTFKTSLVASGSLITWNPEQSIPRAKWIDSHNFTLLNNWVVDPFLQIDNEFQKKRASELYCDLYCFLLHAETLMQPGSSGSPVITYVPTAQGPVALNPYDQRERVQFGEQGQFKVRGLVIRRERFFSNSSFIPAWRIITLLSNYINGSRTPTQLDTAWKLAGPTLIRQSPNSFSESAATGTSSGNGVSMDGGNGGTLNEDNPREILNQISAFPTTGNKEIFMWMMMMRHPITSQLMSYPVWFDPEQYNQLKRFTFALTPEDPSNVLSVLLPRLGKNGADNFADQTGQAKLTTKNSELFVEFSLNNDVVKFKLNSKGYLCESTCIERFDPVIEVQSEKKQTYIVDLRDLFFVNLSKTRSDLFKDPATASLTEQEYQKKFYDYMGTLYKNMSISVRKKRDSKTSMTVEQGLAHQFHWVAK